MASTDPGRIAERSQRLRAIDQDIIDLVRQRQETAGQLRTLRRLAGLGELQLAQENEVVSRYCTALGGSGAPIALHLLLLARSASTGEGGT